MAFQKVSEDFQGVAEALRRHMGSKEVRRNSKTFQQVVEHFWRIQRRYVGVLGISEGLRHVKRGPREFQGISRGISGGLKLSCRRF